MLEDRRSKLETAALEETPLGVSHPTNTDLPAGAHLAPPPASASVAP
jgi:hypothetical protein